MVSEVTGTEVVVVGGGLAGLAAAIEASRAGAAVTVLEARDRLGGRGITDERDGFLLNLGPHAVYDGGAGLAVLRRFGIDPPGGAPDVGEGAARLGERVLRLPFSASALLSSPLLPARAKAEWARLTRRLPSQPTAHLAGTPVAEWLRTSVRTPEVRALIEMLVRTATYTNAPDELSAAAAIEQLALATKGVRYVDGGWATIVAGLRDAAVAAGAAVRQGVEVVRLEFDGERWGVVTSTGRIDAAAVVLAGLGPEAAARLLGTSPSATWPRPVTASVLDLGLSRPPERRILFGVDRPLYFSVHSPPAALAPEGRVLATVLRYHAAVEEPARDVADELWAHAQLAGVRVEDVVLRRYLHRVVVTHGLPAAAGGGLAGRHGVLVPERPGAYLAGDWIGATGQLSDASLASGVEAGAAAARFMAARAFAGRA